MKTSVPTPAFFVLKPRLEGKVLVYQEKLSFRDRSAVIRIPGFLRQYQLSLHAHARGAMIFVMTPWWPFLRCLDSRDVPFDAVAAAQLPSELLRYTLPSRYCDSDKLLNFAWNLFGQVPHGLPRVQAICDWVHTNIEYRFGSGRTDLSASEVIERRYGVCRDFAHVAIALCRAFNLPARYVTGHLPDIAYIDPGVPMDFHGYCEVYLGREWFTFDPRYNVPRIGRVKVAHGLDAVDGAHLKPLHGRAKPAYF